MGLTTKKRNILIHLFYGLCFLSIPIVFSRDKLTLEIFKNHFAQREFFGYLITLIYFYVSYFVLIPKFFFKKKYFAFIIFNLLCLITLSYLPTFLLMPEFHLGIHEMPPPPHFKRPIHPLLRHLEHNSLRFFLALGLSLLLRITRRLKETEAEKTKAELSFLKAQINPHFLFNTLNSIYSLALEKSDQTGDSVVKLSNMMRFVIHESSGETVPLQREIEYLSDYVDLQKMRLGNTAKIHFTIEQSLPPVEIAPLILITFVENAFKYGINSEADSEIFIAISCENNCLHLFVKNTKNPFAWESKKEVENHVGLDNTENRLKLIYPGKHQLQITESATEYEVNLKIELE